MGSLSVREETVLKIIVEEYIKSSEPIGSKSVCRVDENRMSSATIRKIMGNLEERLLIFQPHTSAGRVPTDGGYRYYIDNLALFDKNSAEMKELVHNAMNFSSLNIDGVFREVGRCLGELTGSVGFVVAPKLQDMRLKNIGFVRLSDRNVLSVIVTRTGIVHNVLLDIDEDVKDNVLESMANYLNSLFKDRGLLDVRNHLMMELKAEQFKYDKLMGVLANIGPKMFKDGMFDSELYLDGLSNILKHPEFRDPDKLLQFFKTFEEKKMIREVLERCINENGINIFVGSEAGVEEIDDLGVVTKSYSRGGQVIGVLGVIGPKRMSYPSVVSVVDYSADIVGRILNNISHGEIEDE